MHQIVDQRVDGLDRGSPEAAFLGQRSALLQLAFLADDLTQACKFFRNGGVVLDEIVEDLGHLAVQAGPVQGQTNARIASPQVRQRSEQQRGFTVVHGARCVFEDFHGTFGAGG
ncbi:MAG: hypothetical protein ABIO45_06000 [Burkholderiaceae bacterium]